MNNADKMLRVQKLISRLSFELFGKVFNINASFDKIDGNRIYLQVSYTAPCTKTNIEQEWKGRKWTLSEFMTDDEIIKTAYCAFKMAVEHEIMEAFKVDGIILFNPHVSFEALLRISHEEIRRDEK